MTSILDSLTASQHEELSILEKLTGPEFVDRWFRKHIASEIKEFLSTNGVRIVDEFLDEFGMCGWTYEAKQEWLQKIKVSVA